MVNIISDCPARSADIEVLLSSTAAQTKALEAIVAKISKSDTQSISCIHIDDIGGWLPREEFAQLQKRSKELGVILELHGSEGYAATNSKYPLPRIHGIWFDAWNHSMEEARQEAIKDMQAEGLDVGIAKLNAIDFNPKVFFGPEYLPLRFSDKASEVVVNNADLVISIAKLCEGDRSSSLENIARYALPACLHAFGERLDTSLIESLDQGLRILSPKLREKFISHFMPALLIVQPTIGQQAIIDICQGMQDLYNALPPQAFEHKNDRPEFVVEYAIPMVKALSTQFSASHLTAVKEHAAILGYETFGVMYNLIPTLCDCYQGQVTADSLSKSLTNISKLFTRFDEDIRYHLSSNIIADLFLSFHRSVEEAKYKVSPDILVNAIDNQFDQLNKLLDAPKRIILDLIRPFASKLKEDKSALSPKAFGEVLQAFSRVEKSFSSNENKGTDKKITPLGTRLLSDVFDELAVSHGVALTPEKIDRYAEVLLGFNNLNPNLKPLFFETGLEGPGIARVIERSKRKNLSTISPELLEAYLKEFSAVTSPQILKIAATIYEPINVDMTDIAYKQCLELAARIKKIADHVNSDTPIRALKKVVGEGGYYRTGFRSISRAIEDAERYAVFLESDQLSTFKYVWRPQSSDSWSLEQITAGQNNTDELLKLFKKNGGKIRGTN